jgi:hypothetical protein
MQHLLREQGALLRRDRRGWAEHVERCRKLLGQALAHADPEKPVLILGAGWGLEIPWKLAPRGTTGWDADPFSRMGTLLRHGRWAPWVHEDLLGDASTLAAMAQRCVREPWSGRRFDSEDAAQRLALLVPSLQAQADPLRHWIRRHRPGLILSSNVLGQFGPVVQALVRRAFHPFDPFPEDPEAPDPLGKSLDGYIARAVAHHLEALSESGAALVVIHDRAVFFGSPEITLGPWSEQWRDQLRGSTTAEASDPLVGMDPASCLDAGRVTHVERWLWLVGPDQLHLMEARVLRSA